MNLLLDSHVLVWAFDAPERLSTQTRRLLDDGHISVGVSLATMWELAIKMGQGRLRLSHGADLRQALEVLAFELVPISVDHAIRAGHLPRHHGDPFDRMLVAQAQEEGMTIVTVNPKIRLYDVAVLPA